jgi:GTP cyclohydrolase I
VSKQNKNIPLAIHAANLIHGLDVPKNDLQDPRLDLVNTPARIAKMWSDELLSSYKPGALDALKKRMWTAERPATKDPASMVVEHSIPFTSVCAHHMLPFSGVAAIGYIPNKLIPGASKPVRVLEFYSRMLQVQERLGEQVADFLLELLDPVAVIVHTRAEHCCVSMRGARKPGTVVEATALRGKARDPVVRAEFYRMMPQSQ